MSNKNKKTNQPSEVQQKMDMLDAWVDSTKKKSKKTIWERLYLVLWDITGFIFIPLPTACCFLLLIASTIMAHWSAFAAVQEHFGKSNMISFNIGVLFIAIVHLVWGSIEHARGN